MRGSGVSSGRLVELRLADPVLTYTQWLEALCLWREARGVKPELRKDALRAVLWVIKNRAASPKRWPNGEIGVILQPKQFSSFNRVDPNATRFPQAKNAADWAAWQDCCEVVAEPGADPTNGANHYESCPEGQEPLWATKPPALIVGPFEFYKL